MLDRFTRELRTIDGVSRPLYTQGQGPGVVVMHEVPGLHPDVITFAQDVVDAGFTVWMPDMFGVAGKPISFPYMGKTIVRACVSREFATWRAGRNSPITDWLRVLARHLSKATGGPVGAIGMCLTGGFALAMMVEDCVGAPVLSQPSLPFGVFPWQRSDLGIDEATLQAVKERGVCVLGLRYSADLMVPPARFARLKSELGDRFEPVIIPSNGRFWKHSCVALDRHEPTVQRVIAFFREGTSPR